MQKYLRTLIQGLPLGYNTAFDVTDPGNTSNFSSTLTVYDSLGVSHVINIYFRKDTETATGNSWEWYAVVNDTDSASGATEVQASGTIDFTSDGALDVESAITYPVGSAVSISAVEQRQTRL